MTLSWQDAKVKADVRKALFRAVVMSTEEVRTEAISLILRTSKSGKLYRNRGRVHQASAPGEPPASNTGRLVNSIKTVYNEQTLSGTVVATAAYALHLEFGTFKMEPRPFLRPALAATRGNIANNIRNQLAKVKGIP